MQRQAIKYEALPQGADFPKVVLKSGKDEAIRRFHPWVFSGAIKKIYGRPTEGGLVEVFDNKDAFLGIGHFQDGSITVRIFSFERLIPDETFWELKIGQAWKVRESLRISGQEHTNAFRLLHAEGDGLPGLIADVYGNTAVIQSHSVGMHIHRQQIANAIHKVSSGAISNVYYKSSDTLPSSVPSDETQGYLLGAKDESFILESGNRFKVDWEEGQKTGFFLDQRENRRLLASYSSGKSVLNTFCYTGGFSIYALHAGASLVHSVDSSRKALTICDENATLNGFDSERHQSIPSDTLDFLKTTDRIYDIIVLDPPAYAKHLDARHNAVQGYKRLNASAIQRIAAGGLLFTFSCSQVVDRRLFESTIMAAAIQAGRTARVVHHLSQPPDHPVSAFHPEGEYLKGLVLYFE